MRKILAFVLPLLLLSCDKNILYIQLPNTVWEISTATQTGWACFPDAAHAYLYTRDYASEQTQAVNGTYTVDGHSVVVTSSNGNSTRLIRTYSHLKNSKNKNFTKLGPQFEGGLSGSIWTTIEDNDWLFYYFREDDQCIGITHRNNSHKEGQPYLWESEDMAYSLDGNQVQIGSGHAVLHKDILVMDGVMGYKCESPEVEEGAGPLAGTIWFFESDSQYPGLFIFPSSTQCIRFMMRSAMVYESLSGTYEYKDGTLSLQVGDLSGECKIQDGAFTFLDKVYKKLAE